MKITLRDLWYLAASQSEKSKSVLGEIFQWEYKKNMLILKVTTGAIVSLFIGGVYSFEKLITNLVAISIFILGIITLVIYVIYLLRKIEESQHIYVASFKILRQIEMTVARQSVKNNNLKGRLIK